MKDKGKGFYQGGDIIREKKVESRHTRDVLCLDITENNHMATASDDNSIIFWNTYNAKEGKRIQIPDGMISETASIQAIRFATRDSNDFLFVFLTSGHVYILETQSETFLEPPDFADTNKASNAYSFLTVQQQQGFSSLIDIKPKANESDIPGAE